MLTGSRRPAATSTSASVETAKPVAIAWILYFPGASPLNTYAPSELVVAVLAAPEASVKVTVAPTIAAPNSSEITPRRVSLACAKAEVENAAARIRAAKQINRFLVFIIRSFSFSKTLWSAPAERSGDGALDVSHYDPMLGQELERRRRFALPAHSKLSLRPADSSENAAKATVEIRSSLPSGPAARLRARCHHLQQRLNARYQRDRGELRRIRTWQT